MRDTIKKNFKRKATAFSIRSVLFHSAVHEPAELGIVPIEQNRKIAHASFPSCIKGFMLISGLIHHSKSKS